MKRSTPHHPKMYALSEALAVPLAHAVGIMEMLWQHAAQHTPQGDIGSLPDAAIAGAVGWKKPTQLTDALISSGWLESNSAYRLIVHDWPDHCEQSVVKWLEYNRKDFLPIYGVSLENRKRKSRESLPSRGAKAEAVVLVSEKQKTQEVSALWLNAGFASPEYFEAWWLQVVENHPNRSKNTIAKVEIFELIVNSQFNREEFESGYAELRDSKSDDWTKEGGKYCTNLYEIIHNRLWKFKPADAPDWVRELQQEQNA